MNYLEAATELLRFAIRRSTRTLDEPALANTPKRITAALDEMTRGYGIDTTALLETTFPADGYDEIVAVRDIGYWSLCEHHLLPFHGRAAVAYLPAEGPESKIVGLSKLARLVDAFACRLQTQERLTNQIATTLERALWPRGVAVVVTGAHACMQARGVRAEAEMVTSCMLGVFRDKPEAREEVLRLLRG